MDNNIISKFVEKWKEKSKDSEKDINNNFFEIKDRFNEKLNDLADKHDWINDLKALYKYAIDGSASAFEKTGILLAILYLINPFDLVHDYIPVVGYIDDGIIIGFLVTSLKGKIDQYR